MLAAAARQAARESVFPAVIVSAGPLAASGQATFASRSASSSVALAIVAAQTR